MEKCTYCGFFEANVKTEEVLKTVESELSRVLDNDTLNQLKPKMGVPVEKFKLCPECAMLWSYLVSAVELRHTLDEENYMKLLELLLDAKFRQTHNRLKQVVMDQEERLSPRTKDVLKNFYRTATQVFFLGRQPQHVSDLEGDPISLQKRLLRR